MLDFRTLWRDALTYEAFLAGSTKHKGLWEGNVRMHCMPRERSIDVDTLLDFRLVEMLMKERIASE